MQVWNSWHTGRGVSRRLTADLTVAGVGVGCSQYPRFTDLTVAGVGVGMQSVSEVRVVSELLATVCALHGLNGTLRTQVAQETGLSVPYH